MLFNNPVASALYIMKMYKITDCGIMLFIGDSKTNKRCDLCKFSYADDEVKCAFIRYTEIEVK